MARISRSTASQRWTHLFTGKQVEGGRWVRERHGFLSLPLYVRPNTLLAIGTENQRPDYDYALHLFELDSGKGASVTLRGPDGAAITRVSVTRSGDVLRIRSHGVKAGLPLLLRQGPALRDAGSLAARSQESGVILVLPEGESEHTVYL
ncbi:hypothetical protein OKW41_003871 [Paraburkholderia sp. UCT70]|uniref:hypothetical protein n=1 Tax=Paraburkholderia sp. UCT70 TaxID=2991068 RepID=UPI003D25965A